MAAGVSLLVVAGALPAAATTTAFPGSDGRIAFSRAGDLWSIEAAGTGARRLTTGADRDTHPRWSPDGRRLAFVRQSGASRDIWVARGDGSGLQQVTTTGDVDAPPSWSPDGARLVFSTPSFPNSDLQTVRSTAPFGKPVRLTRSDGGRLGVDNSVAWSPDGQHIAFYSHEFPDSPDSFILVYDLATQGLNEFLVIGGECCGFGAFGDLAWGPNGNRLGFSYYNDRVPGPPLPPPVVAMQKYPGGSNGVFATQSGDRQPAFAPSGASVVLVNAGRLVVTAAYGADRRPLTDGIQPDWQPRP